MPQATYPGNVAWGGFSGSSLSSDSDAYSHPDCLPLPLRTYCVPLPHPPLSNLVPGPLYHVAHSPLHLCAVNITLFSTTACIQAIM